MTDQKPSKPTEPGEALGVKLLQSVREESRAGGAQDPHRTQRSRSGPSACWPVAGGLRPGAQHLHAHPARMGAGAPLAFGCRQGFDQDCKAPPGGHSRGVGVRSRILVPKPQRVACCPLFPTRGNGTRCVRLAGAADIWRLVGDSGQQHRQLDGVAETAKPRLPSETRPRRCPEHFLDDG